MTTWFIVLNCIIGSVYLAFVTILAMFIDIEGGGPELYYQVMYFIPTVVTLCIAASVALRRKGYRVKSLITQFIGPAVFAIYLIVLYVAELF
jgi:threonine/homoserine/homoserine lactone efflux protein